MDIRGTTCNLCGALSPSEFQIFSIPVIKISLHVKIENTCGVCVTQACVCMRERERDQIGIIFCGVYLNCTVHRSSHMKVIFRSVF